MTRACARATPRERPPANSGCSAARRRSFADVATKHCQLLNRPHARPSSYVRSLSKWHVHDGFGSMQRRGRREARRRRRPFDHPRRLYGHIRNDTRDDADESGPVRRTSTHPDGWVRSSPEQCIRRAPRQLGCNRRHVLDQLRECPGRKHKSSDRRGRDHRRGARYVRDSAISPTQTELWRSSRLSAVPSSSPAWQGGGS
jgi:hypothetical protein